LANTFVSENRFPLNPLMMESAAALTRSLSLFKQINKKTPPHGGALNYTHRESFCFIQLIILYLIPQRHFIATL